MPSRRSSQLPKHADQRIAVRGCDVRYSAESDAPAWSLGAALRPVAARVYGRSMAGSSGVARRSIAVMSLAGWQIAGRMARHVLRRASCPRCPRAASLFAGVGPDSGQWRDRGRTGRTGPVVPVPGSPGNLWRGVNDGRADRISKVGQYPAHVRPGEYGHRLRQAGGLAACRPRPWQQWDNETQLDSAGLDGT